MFRFLLVLLPVTLLLSSAVHGQSLGDVARQNREKQKAKNTPAAKVVTNDDIPESPAANTDSPKEKLTKKETAAAGNKLSAEQWKSLILVQKGAIAKLQEEIDRINASIQFVVADEYYNGVQHNEHQVQKQKLVEQEQLHLEEMKKRLAETQEAARQAGMGNAIYDP